VILLQCSRCGHQISVSDSLRRQEIRCARCGTPLSAKSQADASATASGAPSGIAPRMPPELEPATNPPGEADTFIPRAAKAETSYSFLSPAKGPGEMGWLAHYRVLRLLGHGGMGIVFEAIDTQLDRPVALKVLKPELATDKEAQERFLREARAMAAVKSEQIVTVHHVGQKHHLPFLAMELLEGESLDAWLQRRGRPNIAEAVRLGLQVARGLAAAHQRGLIHRDIKPGNIFLENAAATELPEERRVKILDFGLARIGRDRSPMTEPGVIMGTPGYMAPEQLEGKDIDARCDLFSLGALLYELTTGQAPFAGTTSMAALVAALTKTPKPPRELNPELPPALAALIESLLAKEPKDRPASANDVVRALDAIAKAPVAPGAASERPPGPAGIAPAVASDTRRRTLPVIVIVLALLLIVALAVPLIWLFAG
jgi:urea transport system substrate-binding protein